LRWQWNEIFPSFNALSINVVIYLLTRKLMEKSLLNQKSSRRQIRVLMASQYFYFIVSPKRSLYSMLRTQCPRLIGSRIKESAIYFIQMFLFPLCLNSTQNVAKLYQSVIVCTFRLAQSDSIKAIKRYKVPQFNLL